VRFTHVRDVVQLDRSASAATLSGVSSTSHPSVARLILRAPAKINLHLRVGPVMNDGASRGYHPLVSWFCTVGFFDTLIVEPRLAGASDGVSPVTLTCDDPSLSCDASNLVMRAAEALAREADGTGGRGETPPPSMPSPRRASDASLIPVAISLQKRIPTGGGLGGGSSDAARTLLGLNKLWKPRKSVSQLSTIAASLGSDVPFFLHGPSCICTGRGEVVQEIASPRPKACLLLLPALHVPTPAVYRRFDEMNLGEAQALAPERQPRWRDWSDLSADQLLPLLANDLEAPAFSLEPELARLRAEAQSALGRPVRMSGSGSSLFTLYHDVAAAELAAADVSRRLNVRAMTVELAPAIRDDV
jgi:4-diphosphocytidyl-2-C-methyl-D-erythritol kinase